MSVMMRTGLFALALAMSIAGLQPVAATAPAVQTAPAAPQDGQQPVTPDKPSLTPETLALEARAVAYVNGSGKWDDAEQILGQAFTAIYSELGRLNIKSTGAPMVEYLDSDEDSFSFKAMVPIPTTEQPDFGQDVKAGLAPSGEALKFVHRGPLEELEQVYNRIDDYLGAKGLTMKEVVEEYVTDEATTPAEKVVTNIYVFTQSP